MGPAGRRRTPRRVTSAEVRALDEGGQDEAVPGNDSPELVAAKRQLVRAVRASAEQEQRSRAAVAAAMLRMQEAGASLRAIADVAGVTHQTVANILDEFKRSGSGQSAVGTDGDPYPGTG